MRQLAATWEDNGAPCKVVFSVPYIRADDLDVPEVIPGVGKLTLYETGEHLNRISKGRYATLAGRIIVSSDPNAP